MNTLNIGILPGIIHTSDAYMIQKANKVHEALLAFRNGATVYVNNVEVLDCSSKEFLGRDKIIPFNKVISVTTIS